MDEDEKDKVAIDLSTTEGCRLYWHGDDELYLHTAEGLEVRLTTKGRLEVKGVRFDV